MRKNYRIRRRHSRAYISAFLLFLYLALYLCSAEDVVEKKTRFELRYGIYYVLKRELYFELSVVVCICQMREKQMKSWYPSMSDSYHASVFIKSFHTKRSYTNIVKKKKKIAMRPTNLIS